MKNNEINSQITCKLCNSEKVTNIELMKFFLCNDCDCIFKKNFSDQKKSLLKENHQNYNSVFMNISKPFKMRFWDLIAEQYVRYLKSKTNMKFKNAIDVGALYGHLVKRLNELGINTKGIEVEKNYIINDVSGMIQHGYFDETYPLHESYDLVCLTQMIYYVKNPVSVIKRAKELLNSSGIVFISTQNPNSSIIQKGKVSLFEDSMNILPSKKNFIDIANQLNMKIVDFTNFKPNIYLDRLKGGGMKSEFVNYLKYHQKKPYEEDPDGHHSFLLLKKT
ncbi:hypothetical protein C6988_00875 [Nitrosopumilus sp. b1]|uniref:methyltransferase domain-containing protein n=1 Tax=Nitrosopumilus sp. b1 TaxID=2109907 RepID=UPI0015F6EA2D|nr:methyltransferase domain-containing protein [Nitrosopumilus sp. b1]KAF6243994.1 hypothetical protein C6988_00875 [Nitrosopumilus sp. b1]